MLLHVEVLFQMYNHVCVLSSLKARETSHDFHRTSVFQCHLLVEQNNSSGAPQGASGGTGPRDLRPLGATLIISVSNTNMLSQLPLSLCFNVKESLKIFFRSRNYTLSVTSQHLLHQML